VAKGELVLATLLFLEYESLKVDELRQGLGSRGSTLTILGKFGDNDPGDDREGFVYWRAMPFVVELRGVAPVGGIIIGFIVKFNAVK
jgi:hypothetical protein